MKNKLYVITMYKYGSNKNHSYVLGIYSTKTKAQKAGTTEESYRGEKYKYDCLEIPIDTDYPDGGYKSIPK